MVMTLRGKPGLAAGQGPETTVPITSHSAPPPMTQPQHPPTEAELPPSLQDIHNNITEDIQNISEEGKTIFRRNDQLVPQVATNRIINMTHGFDGNVCYCFMIQVISDYNLRQTEFSVPVTEGACRPKPVLDENGTVSEGDLPLPPEEVAGLAFAAVLVVVVFLFVFGALRRPQYLGKILALRRRPLNKKTNPASRQPLLQGKEVLLIYARDISGNENLAVLRNQLCSDFKVYDIFESSDPEKLADPSGWLQAMLLQGSGVKLLVVESAALQDQMHTLLESSTDDNNLSVTEVMVKVNDNRSPVARDGNALLTFALRHILCMELRQDYSRVFVARLPGAQQEGLLGVEDAVDLVVKTKRYYLPCHYRSLKEDMSR